MSKFDALLADLAAPQVVTPRERAHAAACSVQTSLFGRLRRGRSGSNAGRLAWMLIRAAQPDHVECGDALNALAATSTEDLRVWLIAARGARDSLKSAAAAAVAGDVACAVEAALAGKGEVGGAR